MKIAARAAVLFFLALPACSFAASLSIRPSAIIQGDPVMIQIDGAKLSSVKSVSFGGKTLKFFQYGGKPTALAAVDLSGPTGTTTAKAKLVNGEVVSEQVFVSPRVKSEAPLGIPEKLGGNTPASEKKLVDTLSAENSILAALKSGTKAFWKIPFGFPVGDPFVTDIYGYSRTTGAYSIAHKGSDFRAPIGTKVYAMNRGVVRLTKTFRNY